VKLYIDASLDERTRRRHAELSARGENVDFDALRTQIAERDRRDMARAIAPLKQAPDAHLLDTTSLTIESAAAAARRIIDAAR
jgi:cytidylate kinase